MGVLSAAQGAGGSAAREARAFSACCRRRPSPRTRSSPARARSQYRATAGTLPLRDGKGERTAEIFHVSLHAEPESPGRPITFLFNGGPGRRLGFLILGGVGPRMVAFGRPGGFLPPPSRLDDNPDTWLRSPIWCSSIRSAPATAARAGEDEETGKRFFGVQQDAAAWRRSSGSTSPGRAGPCRRCFWRGRAMAASAPPMLEPDAAAGKRHRGERRRPDLARAGVLPCSATTSSRPCPGPWPCRRWPRSISRAGRGRRADLPDRLREVERWAMTDYLVALAAGPDRMPDGVVGQLADVTGLPLELVRRSNGRISVSRFIKEYDRAEGKVLSRYDGMIAGPDPDPASSTARGPDPVLSRAVPAWTTAFVDYARRELGYTTDVSYRLLDADLAGKWDYGGTPTRQGYAGALDDLQAARAVVAVAGGADRPRPHRPGHALFRVALPGRPAAGPGRRRPDPARGLSRRAHDVHGAGIAPSLARDAGELYAERPAGPGRAPEATPAVLQSSAGGPGGSPGR